MKTGTNTFTSKKYWSATGTDPYALVHQGTYPLRVWDGFLEQTNQHQVNCRIVTLVRLPAAVLGMFGPEARFIRGLHYPLGYVVSVLRTLRWLLLMQYLSCLVLTSEGGSHRTCVFA